MHAITHLQVVSVPVRDQDTAKRFFRDVLGFTELADTPMGEGMRWVQLGLPDAQTSITLVTWFPTLPPGSLKGVVLATGDLDAAYAELSGKGLALSPIESAPWGRFATFDDPDGNGFVLQAPPQ